MGKYIGQREICKRLKTENHQLPKLNDMIYTKYEGTEWLDDRYIHITCQSGGDWLMITYKNEKKTDLYVGYDGHKYVNHYINGVLEGAPSPIQILKKLEAMERELFG